MAKQGPRRRRTKPVALVGCRGGRCVGMRDGERVAVMTFRHCGGEMDPLALQLPEARRLISELIRVLLQYGDDYAFALSRAARDSGGGDVATAMFEPAPEPATQTAPRKPMKGPKVRPSRRGGAPTGPIRVTEAWTLHHLLKNLKSHDDFLRFIGAYGEDAAVSSPPSRREKSGRAAGRKKQS